MAKRLEVFAGKITNYRMGKMNVEISGEYEFKPGVIKEFRINGPTAIELHQKLIEIEDK